MLFADINKSLSKISGDEPTIVIVPPRMAQNPIGIAKRLIGISVRAEIRLITGKNSAAAPTFCMKELITPTVPETIGMIRPSVVPPRFKMRAATLDMRPVLSKPAPIIMTAIIEMTAFDEKPENNSLRSARLPSPGNVLSPPKITMTKIAARSIRMISETNRKTVNASSPRTVIIS